MGHNFTRLLLLTILLVPPCLMSVRAQPVGNAFGEEDLFVPRNEGKPPGPVRMAGDSFAGPQPFDVLHYRLDISLSMANEDLAGRNVITVLLTSPVDSITLNETALRLDTVRVDDVPCAIRIESANESFTIRLPVTRNAGDTLHIEIAYRRIPTDSRPSSRRGYYFFRDTIGNPADLGYTMSEPSDARYWMPCFDQPWDKATAEINATVPAGFVAASNGRLLGQSGNADGTVTWHWREDHQIATYLMCVTCSRWSVAMLPYVRGVNDTIPLQYYVWRPDSAQVAGFLPTVRQMMSALANVFGPYPFDKYGMTGITPFSFGGMEHQTITSLLRLVETNAPVVVHELAHQWWGDLVTCATWPDIWLNESFATYAEALWNASVHPATGLKDYMTGELLHFNLGSWLGAVHDPVSQGLNLFDDVVYGKGAWVLHTLRGVLGDSLFFQSLRAYREKFAGRSATTEEFAAVVSSVAGNDMSWFFNEWIYAPGWPQYALNFSWHPATLSFRIYQMQSSELPTYRMPVQVQISYPGKDTTVVVLDSLREQLFTIAAPVPPVAVTLDRDWWILKQVVDAPPVPPDTGGNVPLVFALGQNYPNPFNSSTTIRYTVPTAQQVSLDVFDVLGRRVATLVDTYQPAAEYVIRFSGKELASGVYVYRLKVGGFAASRKMVLVR